MKMIKDIEKYSNLWVALNEDKSEVRYSAKNFQDLMKIVEDVKEKIYLLKLPPFEGSFSP